MLREFELFSSQNTVNDNAIAAIPYTLVLVNIAIFFVHVCVFLSLFSKNLW